MKKTINLIILLILILPIQVKALTATVYCPDDNDPLTVRQTPGGMGITSAACGSKLNVIDTNGGSANNCTWYKVEYDSKTGYVCSNYVKLDSTTTDKAKVLCEENDSPLSFWKEFPRVTRLDRLSCNTEVSVLDRNAATEPGVCNKWFKVNYNGTIGYACGDYLQDVNSSSKPVNPSVGKSSQADNIYIKNDYENKVDGDGTIACYEDTTDAPLKSAVASGTTTGTAKCGDVVRINSSHEYNGNCKYYYNITNQRGETGYICGYYVNTTKLSSYASNYYKNNGGEALYKETLTNLGFPSNYHPYLLEIHARHPNWNFVAEPINIDFGEAVNNEAYTSRSLLQGSAFNSNYLSMDINSYDILNNRFIADRSEPGYYNASKEAIAYYMDPRTYLNEKYIFAFESLLFNPSFTKDHIKLILTNSFWPSVYQNFDSDVYTDVIKASQEVDVSPVHIASRMKQEISGISTSDPRLGGSFTWNGITSNGFYNFFNIKVYGDDKISRGMGYARDNGWNTPYKAIKGGASFIKADYIGINQDTPYYEKFDVSTTNGHYNHQYMQNLAATVQETNIAYTNLYLKFNNYLSSEITFTIPVYKNMSTYAVTSPRLGNPNNFLKDLTVNGNTINGFDYDKYIYDITVPSNTTSINIGATPIVNSTKVSSTGNITTDTSKTVDVKVTADTGRVRTYRINITKQEPSQTEEPVTDTDMTTILDNTGVKYNNNIMYGINERMSTTDIINNIKKVSVYANVSVKDRNGNPKSGTFKTGDTITISNTTETKTFNIVIYGDINGDGKINKDDCLAILRQINGYTSLKDVYKESADANHDGKINKDDCLAILRHLNGYTKLNG